MKLKKILCCVLLAGYLAGVKKGHIALWKGEDPEPIAVLPYQVKLLPPKDQAALEKGIPLPDSEALTRFLEDFCS